MINWLYQLLRRTQKYTGTDNVYLFKNGFWLTLGQVISLAVSLLSAMIFANLLDPVIYGNYKYILSLMGTLTIFTLTGMGTAVTQATARELEGSFYTGFQNKLKWGTLGSLAAMGGAAYYWIRGNAILPIPLMISAIFLPLMYASGIYNSFLVGRKLFSNQTKYAIISQIIFTGTMIGAILLTKNLLWLIAMYFVANTLINYFFYFWTKTKFKPNRRDDGQTISYGKHVSLMGVIGIVAGQLDKILLFTFIGSSQLAIYSFALLVPDQIRDMSKNINTLAIPKFSARSPEEIKAGMKEKSLKLFLLAAAIIVAYIFIAPYIYQLFFPKYLSSVFYSQIYILSLLTLPFTLIESSFWAKARKKELYIIQMTPFLQIILMLCLIPFFGIMGTLAAVLGTKLVGVLLYLYLFKTGLGK